MKTTAYRHRGEQAVVRYMWFNRVYWARPVTVVEDSENLTALYLAPGTVCPAGGRPDEPQHWVHRLTGDWEPQDWVWQGTRVLMLSQPGAAHSVWGMWSENGGELIRWYVNLQEPMKRSEMGWDTRDLILDIEVNRDLSWRWKDEGAFREAQRIGLLTPEEATAVRLEGEKVIDSLYDKESWWLDWGDWSPDPSWPIPPPPNKLQ